MAWWDEAVNNGGYGGSPESISPYSGIDLSFGGTRNPNTTLSNLQAAKATPQFDAGAPTPYGTGSTGFGMGGTGTMAPQPTKWDKFWGTKETGPGQLATGFNVAQGLGNLYLGSEQLGLAKEQLAANKQQFSDQFNIQKQSMNRDIYDQGRRRYEMNKETNLDPDAYYEKNKITAGR